MIFWPCIPIKSLNSSLRGKSQGDEREGVVVWEIKTSTLNKAEATVKDWLKHRPHCQEKVWV